MRSGSPESTERRSAWAPWIIAALLLAGAAAVLLWLHLSGQLGPLVAGTPSVVVELPAAATMAPQAAATPEAETAEPPATSELPMPAPADIASRPPAEPETPASVPPAAPQPQVQTAPAELSSAEPPPLPPGQSAPPPASEPPQAEQETAQPTAEPEAVPAPTEPAESPPPATLEQAEPAEATGDGHAAAMPAQAGDPPTAAPGTAAVEPAQAPASAPAGPAAPQVALAWQRMAQPFPEGETRPRIAVVVAGLGLSEVATTAAIQQLPAEVTLSFSPYSNRLDEFVAMARAAGHEVLLDLPMEPASFPRDDPGPQALLTSLDAATNARRLAWTLGRAEGYLGVATYMGSRFTTSADHLRPVLGELRRRGLLLLDSRAAADSLAVKLAAEEGVAHAINDRFVDNEASRVAIDGRLQQIERIARTSGVAVAMGYAYPVTIERLTDWARGLSGKGLALAPISAVADRQQIR